MALRQGQPLSEFEMFCVQKINEVGLNRTKIEARLENIFFGHFGFDSVGRVVASELRDHRFEACHRQILCSINGTIEKMKIKKRRGRECSIFKTCS